MLRDTIITREEALDTLRILSECDLFTEEIANDLSGIIYCLEEELLGRHVWGADATEIAKIHVCLRKDLWTEELIHNCEEITMQHTFTPAPYEEEEIARNIREENYMWEGEEEDDAPDELPFP